MAIENTNQEPKDPSNNPRYIKVPGSERIYDRNLILLVILIPLMMALMQVSSVDTALPALKNALDASDSQQQWVLSGYALAIGICLVPAGRLGDIFGRSGAFVTGLAIFSLASLSIGLSNDATLVNLLRIFQGIGAGILSPQSTGLIQEYFRGRARAKAFSLFGLVVSMSVAAGPLLSGLLIDFMGENYGWRTSFIINFPLGVLGLIAASRWLPFAKERRTIGPNKDEVQAEYRAEREAQHASYTTRAKGQKVDVDPLGLALLIMSVLGIMLPFILDSGVWRWALLPAGLIMIAAFVAWESYYKKIGHFPMVDLKLFRIKTFSFSTAVGALQFLGTTSVFVILALFLQNGLGLDALTSATVSLTSALFSGIFAIVAGRYAVDKGREAQTLAISMVVVAAIGFVVCTWVIRVHAGVAGIYWLYALPSALLGIGQGSMGSVNQTQAMLDVPPAHGGTAGGIIQTAQRIATAIGNAIITAAFMGSVSRAPEGSMDGYYHGMYLGNTLVAIFAFAALIVSLFFLRDGRKNPHQSLPEYGD